MNLTVPGKPEYKIHITKTEIPRLGVVCKIPDNSSVDLELYRRCIQSTKKNIKDDKKAWVSINNIAVVIPKESPQHSIK